MSTLMTDGVGLTEEAVRQIVRQELALAWKKDPAAWKAAIIASKGTLDWAYPVLQLATTAAGSGMDVSIFFFMYALNIIHKDFERKLRISPVANPAMPMPVPMPDLIAALPGMVPMATRMMRSRFKKQGLAPIGSLLQLSRELGVCLVACEMTLQVFGYGREDFIDGVEFGTATSYLTQARHAHLTLFV